MSIEFSLSSAHDSKGNYLSYGNFGYFQRKAYQRPRGESLWILQIADLIMERMKFVEQISRNWTNGPPFYRGTKPWCNFSSLRGH